MSQIFSIPSTTTSTTSWQSGIPLLWTSGSLKTLVCRAVKTRLNSSRRSGLITATCIPHGHLSFFTEAYKRPVLKYHADARSRTLWNSSVHHRVKNACLIRSCRLPIKRRYGKHASLRIAIAAHTTTLSPPFFPQLHDGWDKLPRPQHLWQPELIEIFEEKLARRATTRLDDSLVSFKHMGDMQFNPIQESYFEWILERLRTIPEINAYAQFSPLSG